MMKIRKVANQRGLAGLVAIRRATLTHHLNTMEFGGLITGRRDPTIRGIHAVELTEFGRSPSSLPGRHADQ